MTTDQLRKSITLTNWAMNSQGICMDFYFLETNYEKSIHHIFLPITRAAEYLQQIGEIDILSEKPLTIVWVDKEYTWEQFIKEYNFSQYDAFRLVVKYEYEKVLANDVAMLEMDKAIEALKNI